MVYVQALKRREGRWGGVHGFMGEEKRRSVQWRRRALERRRAEEPRREEERRWCGVGAVQERDTARRAPKREKRRCADDSRGQEMKHARCGQAWWVYAHGWTG